MNTKLIVSLYIIIFKNNSNINIKLVILLYIIF